MRKKFALSGKERSILNILHLPANIFKYSIIQKVFLKPALKSTAGHQSQLIQMQINCELQPTSSNQRKHCQLSLHLTL